MSDEEDVRIPQLREQMELLKFLREESEANRNAQRSEAEAIRKLFTVTSSIVAIPLGVALVLAGIFWFRDMNTMKQSMRLEGEAAAKLEIQKMDSHIDETLQTQFSTKSMQDRIDRAAEVATEGKARDLIESRVKRMIDPLNAQAQRSVSAIHIQELITKANADDAKAFDELISLKDEEPASQRDLITRVVDELHRREADMHIPTAMQSVCADPKSQLFQDAITSSDAERRKNAIWSCAVIPFSGQFIVYQQEFQQNDVARKGPLATELVRVALNDPSLSVRALSVRSINSIFRNDPGVPVYGFDLLDTNALRGWWKSNEPNRDALVLLAFAKEDISYDNSLRLYEDIQRYEKNSEASLAKEFHDILTRMRSEAVTSNTDPLPKLEKQLGRHSCPDVEGDFEARLRSYHVSPNSEEYDDHGLWETEYLKTCPVEIKLLPQVAEFVASTHRLNTRYGAITVVNAWTGSNLDPFDAVSFKNWWVAHKADYEK